MQVSYHLSIKLIIQSNFFLIKRNWEYSVIVYLTKAWHPIEKYVSKQTVDSRKGEYKADSIVLSSYQQLVGP